MISSLLRPLLSILAGIAAVIAYLLFRGSGGGLLPPPPSGKKWLTCGKGSGQSQTETIGPGGGIVRLHGHVLTVPPGAVTQDTRFTLREPPTPQVMVIVTSPGRPRRNLSLTMSWERCGPGVNPPDPEIFRDFKDNLGGIVRGQTITTDRVDHLSRFIIAQG